MNDIREIVTRAVVGKGKKQIRLTEIVTPTNTPDAILGCWIINHEFEANKKDKVEINGSFEVNIWYSFDNNRKTEVSKHVINYFDEAKVRQTVKEYSDLNNEVSVKVLQQPTCDNAIINENEIKLEIMFEVLVEVIGEAKMRVSILSPVETIEEEIDYEDMDINENFLDESKEIL